MNRHDLGCLAVAITSYLASEHFAGLAPTTQRTRRSLLRTVFTQAQRLSVAGQRLSVAEISEARKTVVSMRDRPWRPSGRKNGWLST